MALFENDFFAGNIDKIKMSIMRLQHNEPPENYYLAFSGGKDSIVIKKLAELAKVKFESHYQSTTIDPPELIYFIREYHPDVKIHNPKIPFLKQMVSRGFPMRQSRWCCEEYKEGGGEGRTVITGIRWAESYKRSRRKSVEICMKGKRKIFIHPIIEWTDNDVWEFIKKYKLPYCKLYDEGWKRIGCLFCPMAPGWQRKFETEKYPRYKKAFMKAFILLYNDRKKRGRVSVDRWKSGIEMFNWWIAGKGNADIPDQTVLFE